MKAASLRARLLWSVGLATLAVWSIAVLISYQSARHEAIELLDGQLAQSARLLLSQARHAWPTSEDQEVEGASEADAEEEVEIRVDFHDGAPAHDYEQPLEFRIWSLTGASAGQAVLRSGHAPDMRLNERMGYATIEHAGQEWRTLTHRDSTGRFQVQVAQPTNNRTRAALEVALRVSMPFAIALPLLVALLFLAVNSGLKPLERLAREVGRQAPQALSPLPTQGMPDETLPLLKALNTLLERLGRALDNERRFTADAAHELRTPLAALKVQAQVAQMAQDDATRTRALGQVLAGVERAARLVEQLLRLARLDPMQRALAAPTLRLRPFLEALLEPLREAEPGVELIFQADADLALHIDGDLLSLAVRNLLDNARRHAAGRIELGAAPTPTGVRIWVRDDGPGVAEDELTRLTERFYRGRGARGEGSGLGLAIVHRIAELHHGTLRLENLAGGGFSATLDLPADQPESASGGT